MVERNTLVYRKALATLRESSEETGGEGRDLRLGATLYAAAEVPLAIAEVAADVAELAAAMARHAVPDRRADAAASAVLAEGAVRAATTLVGVNLTATTGDPRVVRANVLSQAARSAAQRALDRVY